MIETREDEALADLAAALAPLTAPNPYEAKKIAQAIDDLIEAKLEAADKKRRPLAFR